MKLLIFLLSTFFAGLAIASDVQILRSAAVLSMPYITITTSTLTTRSSSNLTTGTAPLNPDGTLNTTAWSSLVNTACMSRLRAIAQSTNPSGTCICYNLPSLHTKTGKFSADLRLYRISDPRGGFKGVSGGDVEVKVGYAGATADQVMEITGDDGTSKGKRDNVGSDPELLKTYMLSGQILTSKMSDDLSMADLESLLMPNLTLTAQTSSANVSTTVSPNEASFLVGVFSDSVVTSDLAAAQAAVDASLAKLHADKIAFLMPGTQILVFPVGSIITGTWAIVGVSVYALGTWERWKFAGLFRRRVIGTAKAKTASPWNL